MPIRSLVGEVLETQFIQRPTGLQLLVVVLALLVVSLFGSWLVFSARRVWEHRLHPRNKLVSRVRISWWDDSGLKAFDDVSCRNLSEWGLGVEHVPERIKVGTRISFKVLAAHLEGTGVVRRCARARRGYTLGIEITRRGPALPDS